MPLGYGQVGFTVKRCEGEAEEFVGEVDMANISWSTKFTTEGDVL